MSSSERPFVGAGDEENPENPAPHNETLHFIYYGICIQGQVTPQWFDSFDGLVFRVLEKNRTLIRANFTDKSALHGLLTRIGELNLTVLSINKTEESFTSNET